MVMDLPSTESVTDNTADVESRMLFPSAYVYHVAGMYTSLSKKQDPGCVGGR